ncbi:hypothetical protein BJV82DRAFT_634029 [Fennellomyces sp. T-0311]|nr:hypothetical protein BJV82DRAFT_634029 [Fennellomyces sp. T-0311]
MSAGAFALAIRGWARPLLMHLPSTIHRQHREACARKKGKEWTQQRNVVRHAYIGSLHGICSDGSKTLSRT